MSNVIVPQSGAVHKWQRDPKRKLLSRQKTIARSGAEFERTSMLSSQKARQLATALSSVELFTSVSVHRNHHLRADSTDDRFYVRFKRQSAGLTISGEKQAEIRIQRAALQFGEMQFVPIVDHFGWYFVLHFYSDAPEVATYETNIDSGCTCPDYKFRLSRNSINCKHQFALRIELGIQSVELENARAREAMRSDVALLRSRAGRDAWYAREMETIW